MRVEASSSHTTLTAVAQGARPPAIKGMHFESEGVQLLPLTPEEIAEAMQQRTEK